MLFKKILSTYTPLAVQFLKISKVDGKSIIKNPTSMAAAESLALK